MGVKTTQAGKNKLLASLMLAKISSLSKQFIQWDNVITQCEIAVGKDKSSED